MEDPLPFLFAGIEIYLRKSLHFPKTLAIFVGLSHTYVPNFLINYTVSSISLT
jgi:hypothetical protein